MRDAESSGQEPVKLAARLVLLAFGVLAWWSYHVATRAAPVPKTENVTVIVETFAAAKKRRSIFPGDLLMEAIDARKSNPSLPRAECFAP
jgi:hypothetical protein